MCLNVCASVCVSHGGEVCSHRAPGGQPARTGARGEAVVTQGNGDFKALQTGCQNRGPHGEGSVNRAVCVCV